MRVNFFFLNNYAKVPKYQIEESLELKIRYFFFPFFNDLILLFFKKRGLRLILTINLLRKIKYGKHRIKIFQKQNV